MSDFPQEKYIDLENNPYLLGRVTVHHVKEEFHVEVDIVYHQLSAEEAVIIGVQRLRLFLDKVQKLATTDSDNSKENLH
jgi:hypothetical protein